MKAINQSSSEIYQALGAGYGFNGSKDEALKLLDEKLTEIAKHYADKAFCAGRSKTPWMVFYANNFV